MIKYEGIKIRKKVEYLVLSNDKGSEAWIPLDAKTSKLIENHVSLISAAPKTVERLNDEPTD